MRTTAIFFGLALSLTAGAALACPDRYGCDPRAIEQRYEAPPENLDAPPPIPAEAPPEPAFDDGYDGSRPVWREADGGLYMYGHRAAPCARACVPCGCGGEGLTLSSSFFHDAGGVGPIPGGGYYDGGYYGGGGYVFVGGGASSSAFASASARASASVSIRYRGGHGHKPGRHKGKH